jgi:solute carrier family 15 oligopeptide transporter 1
MKDKSVEISPNTQTTTRYPKAIAFIISNEFCERFNYYGMRTILVLYLTIKLGYDDDTATVLFHIFTSLVYLFPLIGAILADSYLGKFRTILWLSCVYAAGSVLIAIGAVPVLNLPASTFTVIGLLLIGLGSGGIKPCVSAFGGDQFKIPEQAKQLATFFSLFYFAINAGSLISTTLTPILRENVHCFGDDSCFSLAFGVPALLMVISITVFVLGKVLYTIKKPAGNMLVLVVKCVINAIKTRSVEKHSNPKEHWLDYAKPKYGSLTDDIKSLFRILILYIPLPFFWALFDQQGSRWTFQATRMDGKVGPVTIKPDQMQVINPLLILLLIPLFDCLVYPVLSKIGIRRPLQKLTLGGILAGVAFLISGLVELSLEKTYPVIPGSNEGQIRIFNGNPCNYLVYSNIPSHDKFSLRHIEAFEEKYIKLSSNQTFNLNFTSTDSGCESFVQSMNVMPTKSMSYFILGTESQPDTIKYEDKVEKSRNGYPLIRLLVNIPNARNIKLEDEKSDNVKDFDANDQSLINMTPSRYTIYVDNSPVGEYDFKLGGVYTVLLSKVAREIKLNVEIISMPNTVHMLWLIPQYVIMTMGEVMFSVTGLEFSFTQASVTMKSILQACWLLTVAFGNIIVVVIAEAKFFESQAMEFFLFAILMFIDMMIFIVLAMRYKYVNVEDDHKKTDDMELPVNGTNGVNKEMTNGIHNQGFQSE